MEFGQIRCGFQKPQRPCHQPRHPMFAVVRTGLPTWCLEGRAMRSSRTLRPRLASTCLKLSPVSRLTSPEIFWNFSPFCPLFQTEARDTGTARGTGNGRSEVLIRASFCVEVNTRQTLQHPRHLRQRDRLMTGFREDLWRLWICHVTCGDAQQRGSFCCSWHGSLGSRHSEGQEI